MGNNKAYFVDNETEDIYEISASKRIQLERLHPNWSEYVSDRNPNDLIAVYRFFIVNGKLIANKKSRNIFIGLLP